MDARVFFERRGVWAFGLGCVAVTVGVLLHLPMFWMGRMNGFHLAGMPMDPGMIFGMFLIVAGIGVAAYGLLPRGITRQVVAAKRISVHAPEDAPLGGAHWLLMAVLVVALTIDVMKPAALGFVMPGMVAEYGVPKAHAALVPFFALIGTVCGSVLWGIIADIYGRKASILLSAVVFVGTSICGAMPSLEWNMAMCFLMGLGAGGMLPVTYALLAETMPSKHRGWALVLVGGLGAVGGYFAASGFSWWLVPHWSWRILWLLNLPTGLLLICMGGLIPESAKFLLARGRDDEAHKVMARFGTISHQLAEDEEDETEVISHGHGGHGHAQDGLKTLWTPAMIGKTAALIIAALAWGLINFGLLLWMPNDLVSKGYSMAVSSKLLAESALIAFPTVFACTWLYSRWSTKWALTSMIAVTLAGLIGVWALEAHLLPSPVLPVALLIIGSNGMIAILLPYASESYPMKIRGRATGWVAACTKGGGVLAQSLSITALVPALGIVAAFILAPIVLTLFLFVRFGTETLGLDLRHLETPPENSPESPV
ncbi:MFS transporter [Asticcacaulis sp. EMRT-3]|uniref:MFS transporter n=1 Tax=Asticcacaulis sp. EMRT-3 TaxID=3040349 RepID=UPI0024AEF5D8|nr:MFS transporter [Asticcacaulis sp. EMRT-3]MDI7775095.1 MFS transporter [Asticcacaulis sp. EMRT-3]